MYGKDKYFKVKRRICNVPIEIENICNTLPQPAVSNVLIIVKLKLILNTAVMYILNQLIPKLYTRHLLI